MKSKTLVTALGCLLAAAALGGCAKGTKVTFVNHTSETVDAEFFTQGGPQHVAHTRLGKIPPGEDKVVRKEWDLELLPARFSITIEGATPSTKTVIFHIPEVPPKKMHVDIRPDVGAGYVIEVHSEKGEMKPVD